VLAKHWPGVPCHQDVRTFPLARGMADVVTAGFPCQDISFAGDGAGLTGARSGLWWKVRRTLRVVRPRFAVLENVAALLHRGMGTVLGGLAAIGYDAEWHCIPAAAVGAPHERDRVWIIASDTYRNGQHAGPVHAEVETTSQAGDVDEARRADAKGRPRQAKPNWRPFLTRADVGPGARNWPPESSLVRVVDGVSADVDAVAAIGNSVVPQIPELIGRAIMQAEGMT
jgi:DNA (cytosine-5)-methyltransferase 1